MTPSPRRSVPSVALTSVSERAACSTAPSGRRVVKTRASPPAGVTSTSLKNGPRVPSATAATSSRPTSVAGSSPAGTMTSPPLVISWK